MSALDIQSLTKTYPGGTRPAVDAVDLGVEHAGLLALVGESGSGKSTLLRLVAGLETPDAGTLSVGGKTLVSPSLWTPPEKRGIGLVFQDNALFPHLTVARNITFALRKNSAADRAATLAKMLDLVGLPDLGKRYPHELSGGQQQRVAIARALAPSPAVLLLDEPFSNLDTSLKAQVRDDVSAIIRSAGTTALFVTHDTRDAAAVADRVALMHDGKILQIGTPTEIYDHPVNATAARLFGPVNVLPKKLFPHLTETLLRPEQFEVTPGAHTQSRPATVEKITFAGENQHLTLRCPDFPDTTITIHADRSQKFTAGSTVYLRPKSL